MISLNSTQHRKKATLDDIFAAEDMFGLLDVVALKPKAGPTDLIGNQFENIMTFVDSYGRAPKNTPNATMSEKSLRRQLNAIRVNPEQCKKLRERDRHGLLADVNVNQNLSETPEVELAYLPEISKSELVTSLDDIFADDDLGLLDFDAPEIFTIKHVPVGKKDLPDEIARRQPCPDFERFSPYLREYTKDFEMGHFPLFVIVMSTNFRRVTFLFLVG